MLNPTDPKHAFLLNEIFTSSINAGLQTRNRDYPVYKKDLTDLKAKENMILCIRKFMLDYIKDFDAIDEEGHKEKITLMAKHITENYMPILHNGEFRIGISQKIINLFLKYLWCYGAVKEPFHCPFDSIIKSHLIKGGSSIQLTNWTRMNSMEEYKEYVKVARERANDEHCSIPEWEVKVWNRRNAANWNDADKKCPE
jgi:hypothetical protein